MKRLLVLIAFLLLTSVAMAQDIALPMVAKHTRHPQKAVNFIGEPLCTEIHAFGGKWFYDWTAGTDERCGTKHYPMIWGKYEVSGASALMGCGLPVLTFNEPNCAEQANMTMPELVNYYHWLEAQLPNEFLVGPGMLGPGFVVPYDLEDFIITYRNTYGVNPHMDAVAWHYKWDDTFVIPAFATALGQLVAMLNQQGYSTTPIWITEIGYHCWNGGCESDAAAKLQGALETCEASGRVEYVNWFGVKPSEWWQCVTLIDDGELTEAGTILTTW